MINPKKVGGVMRKNHEKSAERKNWNGKKEKKYASRLRTLPPKKFNSDDYPNTTFPHVPYSHPQTNLLFRYFASVWQTNVPNEIEDFILRKSK